MKKPNSNRVQQSSVTDKTCCNLWYEWYITWKSLFIRDFSNWLRSRASQRLTLRNEYPNKCFPGYPVNPLNIKKKWEFSYSQIIHFMIRVQVLCRRSSIIDALRTQGISLLWACSVLVYECSLLNGMLGIWKQISCK